MARVTDSRDNRLVTHPACRVALQKEAIDTSLAEADRDSLVNELPRICAIELSDPNSSDERGIKVSKINAMFAARSWL